MVKDIPGGHSEVTKDLGITLIAAVEVTGSLFLSYISAWLATFVSPLILTNRRFFSYVL